MLNQEKGNFESVGWLTGAGGGGKGNYYIMAMAFQFGVMKKFWK